MQTTVGWFSLGGLQILLIIMLTALLSISKVLSTTISVNYTYADCSIRVTPINILPKPFLLCWHYA